MIATATSEHATGIEVKKIDIMATIVFFLHMKQIEAEKMSKKL